MKIVVYGEHKRLGILAGAEIVDLAGATDKYLREKAGGIQSPEATADLMLFIEAGPRALEDAQNAVGYVLRSTDGRRGVNEEPLIFDAGKVCLHAPRPNGSRIACAGANFADHAQAMAAKNHGAKKAPVLTDQAIWQQQRDEGIRGFWKLGREIAGQDDEIVCPGWARRLDYEGELAIILGKKGKDISVADAPRYIWGVTLLCDWSIRSPREKNRATRFAMTKNFDTSCSLGPCIVVGEVDAFDAKIETFVNGERRQSFTTKDMVYSFAEYIEHLSTDFTLYPGDVISGGTAAGTAADSSSLLPDGTQLPDRFLKPGDTVEVRSPHIGTLRSRFVAKLPP